MKTALIFGSTGLVGSNLLTLLIKDDYYTAIKIFARSKVNINDPKVEIINLDFKNLCYIVGDINKSSFFGNSFYEIRFIVIL